MPRNVSPRRVCFLTGTRAEFGLMSSTLRAIASHPRLQLQIAVTGMHLDRRRGQSLREISREGWKIDRVVPWPQRRDGQCATAAATGQAMARLSAAFSVLASDVVLVVGDRVEAFAAAAAAHICGRIVAHVHGGDRAAGQVDDSLRHAITKLAHVHFPATRQSAGRIARLGENSYRIFPVGSPGVDQLARSIDLRGTRRAQRSAKLAKHRYALLVLHPADADQAREYRRARMVARSVAARFEKTVIVYPNNDPGAAGIMRAWQKLARDERFVLHRNLPRGVFLGLMRDAAALLGNSSSGIIEAASFGVPVIDIGPRQRGRERGDNVVHVPYSSRAIDRAIAALPQRRHVSKRNVYDGQGTAWRIASVLARLPDSVRFRRKLIAY